MLYLHRLEYIGRLSHCLLPRQSHEHTAYAVRCICAYPPVSYVPYLLPAYITYTFIQPHPHPHPHPLTKPI
ncbi:unnamed protein product, partial [Iphiclides podalirius]